MSVQFLSVITCPVCRFAKEEIMPADACQYFYVCTKCNTRLQPAKGVGSSRVDLQACKLEYSIVSPK